MSNVTANASVSSERRVMLKDIAKKLGISYGVARKCMSENSHYNENNHTFVLVRQTAQEMGYKPQKRVAQQEKEFVCACGKTYLAKNTLSKMCPACRKIHLRNYQRKFRGLHVTGGWYGGNFSTKEAETARMLALRDAGYSNAEIASKIGRDYQAVLRRLGKQDPELTKQNVAMSHHIRAQRNAARKQYVINKPIMEYNRRVEQHNQMKAELNKLQTELLTEKPEIMKAAQTEIKFPMVDLKTVQPTALQ